jgi:hypothetical protein
MRWVIYNLSNVAKNILMRIIEILVELLFKM